MGRVLVDFNEFYGMTYGQILDKVAEEVPGNEAFIFESQRITYAQCRSHVRQIAMALKRLGMRKGDRVGVLFPCSPDFFYVQQAIMYVGGIFIPLSTRYRKFEINYMMKHSGARFMFSMDKYLDNNFIDIIEEILPDLQEMESIIIKGDKIPSWAKTYGEVVNLGQEIDEKKLMNELPGDEDIASILYTSGSTGMPKGVMCSHKAHIWDFGRIGERLQISRDDVFLLMVPPSHLFGLLVVSNTIMAYGKMVIMETFDPGEALRLQELEKVSVLYGVPTLFTMMLGHPEFDKFDLSSNRTGYMSGASCPVELVRAVMKKMHCNISAAYGLSEGGCITVTEYEDDEYAKSETSGIPLGGVDLKIADNDRNEVEIGEVGEIAFRGENLFSGYFRQPELTDESFDCDGFFYTGDLGKLDKAGRLRIVGRKKEMIIRGGFNVYPAEVEEQIALIEGIQHVAVVGVPDQKMGEKICACVVPLPGYQLSEEKIIEFCKKNLANYKRPDFVEIMKSFPMTTSQKIHKLKIGELMTGRYGEDDGHI